MLNSAPRASTSRSPVSNAHSSCNFFVSDAWVFYLELTMGLPTRDLGSGSDADRGSRSKDHFTSTRPRLGSELRAMLRCTVREIQSSSAMRAVFMAFKAHVRPHWIQTGDPDPVNPVSVPLWRALSLCKVWSQLVWCRNQEVREFTSNIFTCKVSVLSGPAMIREYTRTQMFCYVCSTNSILKAIAIL